jgi:GGDEF domain-containing protein
MFTVRFKIDTIFPYDGNDTGTLVKKADEAIYHAKSDGKNQF